MGLLLMMAFELGCLRHKEGYKTESAKGDGLVMTGESWSSSEHRVGCDWINHDRL